MIQFNRAKSKPKGAADQRLYAIGDVHGCLIEMVELLKKIEADHNSRVVKKCSIVFLGDLIDRGPSSKQVIDYLINYKPSFADIYVIIGNHEEMFLRAMGDESRLIPQWLKYGGNSCVKSYEIDIEDLQDLAPEKMRERILEKIPDTHFDFFDNLLESIQFGDYYLVHAGVDPAKKISNQNTHDMRWIREPFLSYKKALECVIVHGHTIEDTVTLRKHRIGVDTGAHKTGILSAVRLEDEDVSILST